MATYTSHTTSDEMCEIEALFVGGREPRGQTKVRCSFREDILIRTDFFFFKPKTNQINEISSFSD